MIKIVVPKDGASDATVTITEVYFVNGQEVSGQEVFLCYETSKASFELEVEKKGFIYYAVSVGEKVPVGEVVAVLTDVRLSDVEQEHLFDKKRDENGEIRGRMISRKARQLIDKYGIEIDSIIEPLITEGIVQKMIDLKIVQSADYSFSDRDIVIYGAGGHAGMCYDMIKSSDLFNVAGFIDDNQTSFGKVDSLKYLGTFKELSILKDRGLKNVVIGIGFLNNLKKRESVFLKLKQNFNVPTIIHGSAIIEPSAVIKDGSQIMAGAIIGSNVEISENCIINSGSIISHDCIIGSSTHITPGAILAGHVSVGSRTTIGMGATIYISSKIGSDVLIANGVSVLSDVISNQTRRTND